MGRKFDKLEHHIAREYEAKGKSHKESERIGKATAGKIFRNKSR